MRVIIYITYNNVYISFIMQDSSRSKEISNKVSDKFINNTTITNNNNITTTNNINNSEEDVEDNLKLNTIFNNMLLKYKDNKDILLYIELKPLAIHAMIVIFKNTLALYDIHNVAYDIYKKMYLLSSGIPLFGKIIFIYAFLYNI